MPMTTRFYLKLSLTAVFLAAVISVLSCEVGLGASVDTETPSVSITYPPVDAAIRDSFVLSGDCSDDKAVTAASISVRNTVTDISYGPYAGVIASGQKSWSVTLNKYDTANTSYYNGWEFPDGSYEASITVSDGAGHTSGRSSRSFSIDNTPPLFMLEKPASVNGTAAYGSRFYIQGQIADDHEISNMQVKVYKSDKTLIGTFDTTTNISKTPAVLFAKYNNSDTSTDSETLSGRYNLIYNSADDKTVYERPFYCTITLSDSARQYKNTSTDETTGNTTSTVYYYDNVYSEFISSAGKGLTCEILESILNGTYSGELTQTETAQIKSDFTAKATDTSSSLSLSRFSLNTKVNPSYSIMSYAFSGISTGNLKAASGQTLTFSAKAGLDETLINPATFTVYQFGPYDTLSADLLNGDTGIYTDVKKYADNNSDKTKIILQNSSSTYTEGTVSSYTNDSVILGDITANK